MEKLTIQKQEKIKKMASDRIKQLLIKAGLKEEQILEMSREQLMRNLAEVWVREEPEEEEEEGAVGGAIEKPIEKPPAPMSIEMIFQMMMMERQESERIRREDAEKAERLRREEKEKEKEIMLQKERIRQGEIELRRAELEVQKQQFQMQLEQMRIDREEAERRRSEMMIEYERARKSDQETRNQQIEDKRLREEEKEKARLEELTKIESDRQEELRIQKEELDQAERERLGRFKLEEAKVLRKDVQIREMQVEKEERRKHLELMEKKIELEEARRVEDLARIQVKMEEERLRREALERERRQEQESLVSKIKKIGDAMKHVLPKMPYDIMEVPLYFETVENAFNSFRVEQQFWVKLLLPLMTPKARTVLNRLSFADLDNYEKVKEHLLKEFKLTAREYRSRFVEAKKTVEETYTMFTARLKNLLNYYVRSRKVDKDYEKLFDLMVADKLKTCLPPGPLQFVLSKEGTDCFEASDVADLADIHVNNRIGLMFQDKPRSEGWGSNQKQSKWNNTGKESTNYVRFNEGNNERRSWSNAGKQFPQERRDATTDRQVFNRTPPMIRQREGNASYSPFKRRESNEQSKGFATTPAKRCHNCGSDRHLVKDCTISQTGAIAKNMYTQSADNPIMNRIQVINAPDGLYDQYNQEIEDQYKREIEVRAVNKCTPIYDTKMEPVTSAQVEQPVKSKEECNMVKKSYTTIRQR